MVVMLIIVAILEAAMRCDLHDRVIDANLLLFANKVCNDVPCLYSFLNFHVCVTRVVCQVCRGGRREWYSPRRMPMSLALPMIDRVRGCLVDFPGTGLYVHIVRDSTTCILGN